MADELLVNYPDDIASLTLQPGHKGVFKVSFDDKLQFDKVKSTFTPFHVMGDSYPGWPIVFLNACDAADISPLSFFSFRTKFQKKNAAGDSPGGVE